MPSNFDQLPTTLFDGFSVVGIRTADLDYHGMTTYLQDGTRGLGYLRMNYVGFVAPTPPAPTPPVISNMVPAAGTPIYPTSPLRFDVTDDSGLFAAVIVLASYPDGSYEVVYDSAVFAAKYRSSTMSIISGGFRFVLTRVGGWPASPTLRVIGIDAAGAENPQ